MNTFLRNIVFVNGLKPPPFEYTVSIYIYTHIYIYISMSYCRGVLEMEGIHLGVFRECLLSLILRIADIWMSGRLMSSNFSIVSFEFWSLPTNPKVFFLLNMKLTPQKTEFLQQFLNFFPLSTPKQKASKNNTTWNTTHHTYLTYHTHSPRWHSYISGGHRGEKDAPIPWKSRCHFTSRSLCTTHLQKGLSWPAVLPENGWIEDWRFVGCWEDTLFRDKQKGGLPMLRLLVLEVDGVFNLWIFLTPKCRVFQGSNLTKIFCKCVVMSNHLRF